MLNLGKNDWDKHQRNRWYISTLIRTLAHGLLLIVEFLLTDRRAVRLTWQNADDRQSCCYNNLHNRFYPAITS